MDRELNPFDKRLGARLKEIRAQRGLSLPDVAAEIGVSYQQLQKYEAGRNSISVGKMLKICELLEVVPHALLDSFASDHCPRYPTALEPRQRLGERHRLLRAYFALPEDTRSAFLDLLEITDTKRNR